MCISSDESTVFLRCLHYSATVAKMPFYAVARGKSPGIYSNWANCEKQVKAFPNARYKKFPTKPEAEKFITENSSIQAKSSKASNQEKSSKTYPPQIKKSKTEPLNQLIQQADGYWLSGDRIVVYTDGASSNNQHKNKGGSGCGIYWGGEFCLDPR